MGFHGRIPLSLEDAVKSELRAGEVVRWIGMPDPRRVRKAAWPVLAFGAVFFGFAAFWMFLAGAIAWTERPQPGDASMPEAVRALFPLFGLPFLAVGSAIMAMPALAGRRARRTVCCVTDRRAFRVEARRNVRVDSWSGADLGDVSKELFPDGTGTVTFVRTPVRTRRGALRFVSEGFVGVHDPGACEEALLALKQPARPA